MSVINQKEYLKKYLSLGDEKEKNKKRKKRAKIIKDRVKIIDDDIDVPQNVNENEMKEFLTAEDAPQVVGIIDERPLSMRIDDYRKSDKWKLVGSDDELKEKENNIKIEPNSDSDMTPPRRNKKSDSDTSPPRKNKKTNEDISPPRKNKRITNDDISPPRKNKRVTNDDISPPRRNKKLSDNSRSPPRRNKRLSTDSSPPRRNKKSNSESNQPERPKKISNIDNRPKKSRWDTDDSNISEIPHSTDTSPPRKSRKTNDSPPRKNKKMSKTLDGKTAGIQNADDLKKETAAFKKREDEIFKNMSAETSGKDAAPILRDRKTGKRRDLEKEAMDEMAKQKVEQEKKQKYDKWGKGVKQVEDHKQKVEQEIYEMTKPLARYADDEDLEKYLKDQEREGDPMLQYIRKKKRKEAEASGIPIDLKPHYDGEFMPNRYGIPPGHRWDGVDRSNGYEKEWFKVQNSKTAIEEDIYKWSTEDM